MTDHRVTFSESSPSENHGDDKDIGGQHEASLFNYHIRESVLTATVTSEVENCQNADFWYAI